MVHPFQQKIFFQLWSSQHCMYLLNRVLFRPVTTGKKAISLEDAFEELRRPKQACNIPREVE